MTFDKDDAVAAVEKLRGVIEVVQADVADAQLAADRCGSCCNLSRTAEKKLCSVISPIF